MAGNFRDLNIWKKGHELLMEIYNLTDKYPKEEKFGLIDQTRRSANGVIAGIAEAFGRYYFADKARTLYVARGECSETQSHLSVAFGLKYIDQEGREKEVIVIHRSSIGAFERIMAFLIEKYGGAFQVWLAPVQVKIVTVNDSNVKYAEEIVKMLKEKMIRVELDDRSESIGKKVRDAEVEKDALIVTIGDKEVKNKNLAVRESNGKVKFGVNVKSFVDQLLKDIENRKC